MIVFGQFPEGYDWREHDRRKCQVRKVLEIRWNLLREQLPAMQRIASGNCTGSPVDQALIREIVGIALSETVSDLQEIHELHARHGVPPNSGEHPPRPAGGT